MNSHIAFTLKQFWIGGLFLLWLGFLVTLCIGEFERCGMGGLVVAFGYYLFATLGFYLLAGFFGKLIIYLFL